jgi:glutamate 5-kinase
MRLKRRSIIKKAKRVVVKVGSAVVAGMRSGVSSKGEINASDDIYAHLAEQIFCLISSGREVVLVTSGAIAMGSLRVDKDALQQTIPERQAIAALGQTALMVRYEKEFSKYNQKVAQVLLTSDDLSDRKRFLNARNTLTTLLGMGILPIINENDTVVVDELKFGDNDNLAALTTNLVEADIQVILTDIDGLYDKDPKCYDDAERISMIEDVDSTELDWSSTDTTLYGTGGIATKVMSAKTAAHFGSATVIASGFTRGVLNKLFHADDVGTFVFPKEDKLTSKKHWIAYSTKPSGRVVVDDGAKEALLEKGTSLLPSGVISIDGVFEAGEVVHCVDSSGMEFARGLANYASAEIDKIKGRNTAEIEGVLGYTVYEEIIHRDNLVII